MGKFSLKEYTGLSMFNAGYEIYWRNKPTVPTYFIGYPVKSWEDERRATDEEIAMYDRFLVNKYKLFLELRGFSIKERINE